MADPTEEIKRLKKQLTGSSKQDQKKINQRIAKLRQRK